MFRMGHPADHPLRLRPELLRRDADGSYPILRERTPVRMDLSHSGWSDIFFLGMDFPEGARVLNVSIDLGVHGRDAAPRPPVEAYLRVIDEPVLRLTSVDLGASADISQLAEVFDFARDYLGLLKAAVIAAGIVPPGIEGSGQKLADLLARVVGPGRGLEIVSNVNNIPKGSRLAVSTNLLASLISVCMRATGQARSLDRLVAGGGTPAGAGARVARRMARRFRRRLAGFRRRVAGHEIDLRRGRRRGRPGIWHQPRTPHADAPDSRCSTMLRRKRAGVCRKAWCSSTAAWPKTSGRSWKWSRKNICSAPTPNGTAASRPWAFWTKFWARCATGDVQRIGALTTRNFDGPIQTIIPWASNHFTESLIRRVQGEFGEDFWGFWMLGGMSGGGMGFIFEPEHKAAGAGTAGDDHVGSQARAAKCAALCDGAGGL